VIDIHGDVGDVLCVGVAGDVVVVVAVCYGVAVVVGGGVGYV